MCTLDMSCTRNRDFLCMFYPCAHVFPHPTPFAFTDGKSTTQGGQISIRRSGSSNDAPRSCLTHQQITKFCRRNVTEEMLPEVGLPPSKQQLLLCIPPLDSLVLLSQCSDQQTGQRFSQPSSRPKYRPALTSASIRRAHSIGCLLV